MTIPNVSTSNQVSSDAAPAVQVPCTDVFNRGRSVRLWLSEQRRGGRQIVLVAPPGEAARLTAVEARELAKQLVVQADELEAERKRTRTPANVLRLPGSTWLRGLGAPMTARAETETSSQSTTRPVAFGYVAMSEPDEAEIAELRRRIGQRCVELGYHLVTVFCDRGFEDTDMARPGFVGLLDAVWPSVHEHGSDHGQGVHVLVPEKKHLSSDPVILQAMERALKRQGASTTVLANEEPAAGDS